MFVSARRIAAKLGIRRPLICYQGALVGDPVTGEILLHRPLEAPLAREILSAMPERARPPHEPLHRRRAVRQRGERRGAALRAGRGRPMHVVGPLADWLSEPTTKLVTVGEPADLDALRDELQPRFGSRAFIAKSLPIFLEFAAPGVSKASGLALRRRAARLHGRGDGRVRRRRERPRAARLGRARHRRRRTPTSACWARPTRSSRSVDEDGVAQLLEALVVPAQQLG